MSYGNCVLASDIPENREALEGNGFTFRNKDVGDIESQLKNLLAQPVLVESKKSKNYMNDCCDLRREK